MNRAQVPIFTGMYFLGPRVHSSGLWCFAGDLSSPSPATEESVIGNMIMRELTYSSPNSRTLAVDLLHWKAILQLLPFKLVCVLLC